MAVVERFKQESISMDCPPVESCRCGEVTRQCRFDCTEIRATIPGGGVLPYKRLIGMFRWME